MKDLIKKAQNEQDLTADEMASVMTTIMSGKAVDEDIRDLLLALNDKGPSVEEIVGAAKIMRQFVVPVEVEDKVVLDTCGTGGDGKGTFNISTLTAIVVASCGVTVAKHGNRSVSSLCGSADILESLGVRIALPQEKLAECLKEVKIAFLFAQAHHPAMKHVGPVRKALGVKTIFNVLGPLTNPAGATHQMMGVFSKDLVPGSADVLGRLGSKRALVVHGADGLDEITTTTTTYVSEFNGQEVVSYVVEPEKFGIPRAEEGELKSSGLEENISIVNDVLSGKKGPQRDIVLLNAAFALYAAEKVASPEDGLKLATEAVDSGRSARKLEELIEFTNR